MIPVFFNGHGEWFIKNNQGQDYPHSDLVCYIEYDSYNRRWWRIYPYNEVVGTFMLSEDDEKRYTEKKQRHKELNQKFDEFNLGFVDTLWPLPADIKIYGAVRPPDPEIEGNGRYYFKIKKYKNSEPDIKDKLHYILHPELDHVDRLELGDSTNTETTANTDRLVKTKYIDAALSDSHPAYLDPKHPMFSEELNIAIRAWTEVLECTPEKPKRGSRKHLIEKWLETYHKSLSSEAKKRIATLVNPDKNGGAPSSD
ncbi:hypothetical protein [Methylobacter sp. BlB1]|uniref:hypothetical protein n=1 Tax=Methylobacter sp. BlB1 TaxID=2785914 RepID=UPI0018957C65|nr:hypothetical protein [Methylobacter sp. BlB1]MBF6647184.1 hypothetical protein [Methylobacter sp. BlB1]